MVPEELDEVSVVHVYSADSKDSLEKVEYVDEMGRTRIGTLKEKREAERLRKPAVDTELEGKDNSAYAEVL